MGPLGFQELLLIATVVLLVFGPKRLPEVARTLGRCLSMLREATDDVKETFSREVKETKTPPTPPLRKATDDVKETFSREVKETKTPPTPPLPPAKTLPDPASSADAKERS